MSLTRFPVSREAVVIAPAPSGGDDLAALTAVLPPQGVLQLRAGTYRVSGKLLISAGQNLLGCGGGFLAPATTILCTGAGAGVEIAGSGGVSGQLQINGNHVATAPFLRSFGTLGARRIFFALDITNSAQDNMTILSAQNDLYLACGAQNAVRDNVVLDGGAGGVLFDRCDFNAPGRYGVRLDNQVPTPTDVDVSLTYQQPSHITFNHCIFERENYDLGAAVSQLYLKAFNTVAFETCVVYGSSAMTGPLVDIVTAGRVSFSGGVIQGESPRTAIRLVSANLTLGQGVELLNVTYGIDLAGTSPTVHMDGTVVWNNITNRYTGVGSADTLVTSSTDHPIVITRDSTTGKALAAMVRGESGFRLLVDADGRLRFGDGTSFSPPVLLYAKPSNVLSMPSAQVVQFGNGATGSRPSAAAAGVAGQWYDTTLHKPIWSDGTVWRDAAGTAV